MDHSRLIKAIFAVFLTAGLSACAGVESNAVPRLTKAESEQFEASKLPYTSEYLYSDALEALGRYINQYADFEVRIQPKQIASSVGGQELPYNVTDMVITAASRSAGDLLTVLPFDPDYINNDFQTGGQGSRWLPGYLISGSITEFDKDIESNVSGLNLDLLLGGGDGETDIGYSRDNTSKMSRVAIDLQMLNYNTHAVIPGLYVSNTVNVMEIDKGNEIGFSIYGSGIGVNGKIAKGQGFHRAVRNLVEYSILQLLGRLYNVPYWDLIGMEYPDEDILRSIRKSFMSKSKSRQITAIQDQLSKLDTLNRKVKATGKLNEETNQAIAQFVRFNAPEISTQDLPAVYIKLREVVALSRMDTVLVGKKQKIRNRVASRPQQTVPPVPGEVASPQNKAEQDEPTSPKKFMDQFDRIENVYQGQIFKQ